MNPSPFLKAVVVMANSPTDSDLTDRLSNLPDALLISIISFLPTPIAARTSVLCRRFRHLWEASPSLALISYNLPEPRLENFIAMAKCALLGRNLSHPLHSLSLELTDCGSQNAMATVSSLLAKSRSLDLRHLTIHNIWLSNLLAILPIVFTINSLRCLSLYQLRAPHQYPQELNFPSGINLTFLRSLSLQWIGADLADLNKLLSELCSLEDLHLDIRGTPGFSLSSQTIRKLKLIITENTQKLDIVGLSLPLLESLHLEIRCSLGNLSHIHAKVPLLRKAVIELGYIREKNVSTVDGLLKCISHVEELSLDLDEITYEEQPFSILLESGKDVPKFSNLKHLDVTLCFHEHNLAAVIMMLHNCPILKSLKLVHEINFMDLARGKKRDWQSKLPRNADGNYRYAYFRNLHLEENRKEVIKLLSKKCSSKRSIMDILVEETYAFRGNEGKGLYGKSMATAPNHSIPLTLCEVSSSDDDNATTQQQIDDFSNPEFHVMADSVEVVHESINPSPNVLISEPVDPMPNVPVYEPIHVPSSQNSKRGNNSGDQSSRCTKQKQSVNCMDEFAERFLCQQQQSTELIAQLGQANSVHDQVLNKLQSLALPPAIQVDMELSLGNSWIRSCFIKEDDNERLMIFVNRVVELFRSGQLPLNS